MSNAITTATVQQYATNVGMLLQQQGSRLRGTVQTYQLYGKAAEVLEQFGQVSAVKNLARHSDTPLIGVPQDRRWCYPIDYDWADLIDNQDKLRLLIDPTGPYTTAGAWALGRAQDDEIINGFFGSNNTGENGSTATGTLGAYNSASQVVTVQVGASSNVGLNVAKLRAAKKLLMAAEVDIDAEQLFVGITASQHDNMLNEAQAVSLDYNSKPVLVDGRITAFMGFNFIHSERVPGGASYAGSLSTGGQTFVPFWAKSGVALGLWNDIGASVDRRPDKRNSMQVYVTGTFGATRLEEKRCGYIQCV